ncbi:hypothetical protein [Roseateles sp. YR242]|uniref:hypothetical protein n=1 Tax=Roseateles sp. YR242 TaxID=1855305 RepID=UPI0011601B02|nr:hypothetical protein [Roseateles sp. YR242]
MWVTVALLALELALETWAQLRTERFPDVTGWLGAVVLPLAGGAVLAVINVLVVLAFPVKVLPQALHCYNFWGIYRSVKWGDIVSVKPASIMGLRYLHVSIPAHSQPLTVPLWLRDMPGFITAVETHAGVSNPLAQALRQATETT